MIILIDSNHLSYYHSFRNRGFSHNGQPTNVIFGFLKSLLMMSKLFDSKRFVFAWDSRKSIRKIFHPTYKQSHEKTGDEAAEMHSTFEQMKLLRTQVLPEFGFCNVFHSPGYEADDLIAWICKANPDDAIVIVSSDNDLYQLLTPDHVMYDIKKKKLYNYCDFEEEWDIEPKEWVRVKSLAGCKGDDVPGVKGIGNKTAVEYIKGELSEKSKAFQKIERGKIEGAVANARFLVELPFMTATGLLTGMNTALELKEVFELKDFFSICDRYGFRSFAVQEMIWREQFDMRTRE